MMIDRRGFLGLVGAAIAAPFVPTQEPSILRLSRVPDDVALNRYLDAARIAAIFGVPQRLLVYTETIEVTAMGQRCYVPGDRWMVRESWPERDP